MKTLLISTLLGVAAMAGVGTVGAQQTGTVARLTNVEGSVLVSQGDAMVAVANNQRVPAGARVVTTGSGKVMVRYDSGCDVSLKENQRFTVRVGECPVLLTEVVSVGPSQGAMAVAGLTTTETVLGVVGAGALGYGAYEVFRNKSVSPN